MGRPVAQLILEQLAAWGVRAIYGYPGETILPLLDALGRQDRIVFYATRHEAGAAFMASAEAKLFGRLGVCLAHAGPGLANLLNGLADACLDRAPVLAISGQLPRGKIGTDSVQYLDEGELVRPAAACSVLLAEPAAAVEVLTRAMRTALSRGTAAHVAVPQDLFAQEVDLEARPPEPYLTAAPSQPKEDLGRLMAILNEAQRPMILAGRGARGQGAALLQLAEEWGAGIVTTMPAKGVVPGKHPLVLGGLGEGGSEAATECLAAADLLLVLGATWWPEGFVPKEIAVVQIDADPAGIGRHTPVRHGYVGRIEAVMPELLGGVEAQVRGAWLGRIAEARRRWLERIEAEAGRASFPLAPQRAVRGLERVIAPDAVIALDVGDHTLWFNRVFAGERQEILASGTWRSMGFALPAAIQAKLNAPGRQVVALVGDGGLNMSLPELATAAQYGAAVKIVVFNNGCLAMEKNRLLIEGMKPEAAQIANPDFAACAEACGLRGHRVDRAGELEEILGLALAEEGPSLVDVPVEPAVVPTAPVMAALA